MLCSDTHRGSCEHMTQQGMQGMMGCALLTVQIAILLRGPPTRNGSPQCDVSVTMAGEQAYLTARSAC